jgi:hypothetical protein
MIGHYQGNVAAARRSWATAHRKEVVGFTRAYVAAIDWLYDGTNREEAERILTGNLPQMSRELARTSYDLLLDRNGGFLRQGKVDIEGLKTVLRLRSRYTEPQSVLTAPTIKYYDPSYYENRNGRQLLSLMRRFQMGTSGWKNRSYEEHGSRSGRFRQPFLQKALKR